MSRHPRKHESAARAAQLERIKEQRRIRKPYTQASVRGASFAPVGMMERTPPTDAQVLAEIARISMGQRMPTPQVYDYARRVDYPTAAEVCERMGAGWHDIADEMGLKIRKEQICPT